MTMRKVMLWPLRSLVYKKFRVTLCIHHLLKHAIQGDSKLVVDVKWRGPKGRFRSVKSDRSSEATAVDGVLEWEQEFVCECTFGFDKETGFQPWDVYLVVCKVTQNGSKQKTSVLGKTRLNLGDLAPPAGNARQTAKFPVSTEEAEGELSVTLNFEELRTINEHSEINYRTVIPCISRNISWDREEDAHDEENRVKPINSVITSKKQAGVDETGTDERLTPTSEESSRSSPDRFDSDSTDNYEDNDVVDDAEISTITTFFKYGRIAGANMIIGRYHSGNSNDKVSSWATPKGAEETLSVSSESDQTSQLSMKRMLSWRKRKLSFRSPRARGEPLLNKAYGDAGGDEIDWDRRQSIASDNMLTHAEQKPSKEGIWDFGESFQVGSWEEKELISRDGQMKLNASIFFASIDQRSESAAGEGACTALVAVVADWLHRNSSFMPSRAEFDSLIRDGSADWRKLCQDERYRDGFSDGHFDLETVLEAGVRPLKVIPEKSFVGFFQPEGCDFLDGAMSFDGIWDEVEKLGPAIYIVSWNDHFFLLKVDEQAVYIIDTLGERLFEGCNQAYVLKFDETTCLSRAPPLKETADDAKASSTSETAKKDVEGRKNTGIAAEARTNTDKDATKNADRNAAGSGADKDAAASWTNNDKDAPANGTNAMKDAEVRRNAAAAPTETQKKPDIEAEQGKKLENDEQVKEEEAGKKQTEQAAAAEEQDIFVRGSSACREFVKRFFAAVPLRELESDMKKGLVVKECIHKRLQVELHFTAPLST